MISEDGTTILAPIGLADVRRVLRENTTDLGSLCSSKTINKWAKYKPVSNHELEYESELNSTRDGWKDTATWWRGTDGQCGISNITTYSAADLTADKVAALFAGSWTYNAPRGTAQSPYRAEDFLRYRRSAQSPFGKVAAYPSTELEYSQGGSKMRWKIEPHTAGSDELSLTDIVRGGTAIGSMYFGMLFICIATQSAAGGYLGRRLLKTCPASIGNGGTELELTTADTVKFGSDLVTDTTKWIAYPILIDGVAVTELTEIAAMSATNDIMFAPYKAAVVEAAQPYVFQPSKYDVQSRFVSMAMGTTNYYDFELSIVNKEGTAKTVAQLSDVTMVLRYSTSTAVPSDWSAVTTQYSYGLNSATNLTITRTSADNMTTTAGLSGGWTIEAGESVTISGRMQLPSSGDVDIMTAAQLSCAIKYSGSAAATEYAAGQNSYWYKESDGQQEAKDKTHTASIAFVSTSLVGSQMSAKVRPTVTAKSGTATTSWGAADIKVTLNVQYGGSYTRYFPASGEGTWSNGVWTGSDMEISMTPASTNESEYVTWTIPPVAAIAGTGGAVDITR